MVRIFRQIVVLAALAFVAGCATPYKTPVLDPSDAEFPGVANLMQSKTPVEVVSIHGMCTHGKEWVDKSVNRLDTNLPTLSVKDKRKDPVEGIEVYTTTFVDAAGDVRLRNHALVWSPLTANGKKALCYDSSYEEPSCKGAPALNKRERGSINAAVKTTLMNDCLSDVVLYLGPDGKRIRKAFRASIDNISKVSSGRRTLVLISESLGSKILADAILENDKDKSKRLDFLKRTEQVFMAANQLPLIELTEDNAKSGGDSSWSRFLDEILPSRADATGKSVQVVAFTDPNDLLSYELRNRRYSSANAIVSNDTTWFGKLERPDTAHTGYLDNDSVWEFIVCGHTRSCDTAK